jgi:hypothetical protein
MMGRWLSPTASQVSGNDDHGFNLTTCRVPRERIVSAGMPRDGLAALHDPELLSVSEVARRNTEGRGKFLLPTDRVIGVEIRGDARAYPVRLLRWHEIVNDTVGGVPIVVTYNPLCDAVMAAEREVAGETLSFGVSGLLLNSNLLMYDRREEAGASSLWSQLLAEAVAGPAALHGRRLRLLAPTLTTWQSWLAEHPSTRVLGPAQGLRRLYRRDPYNSYFGSEVLRFPVEPLPPPTDLALKDRVVVVTVEGRDAVFALPRLARAQATEHGTFVAHALGLDLRLRFDRRLGTATVTTDVSSPRIAVRYAFWFAWYAVHPATGEEPIPLPEGSAIASS